MSRDYYGSGAYDSTKIGTLPPIDNSGFTATTRKTRKNPLPRFTKGQCAEHLAADMVELIELFNNPDEKAKKDLARPGHEMWYWTTLSNPRALLETEMDMMGIYKGCSIFACAVMLMVALFKRPEWLINIKFLLLAISPYFVFWLLQHAGKYLLDKDIVKDKNNIYLNRRTGIITIPRKKKPPAEIPFDEFDAYWGASVNPSGSEGYHLWLGHRYSDLRASYPPEMSAPWKINLEWEFWQRYMDVSQPLPDTPRMEPYRSRDPVTAAHDKANNRPPDYWKNMDMQKAEQMHDASYKAAKAFPWGLSREQAMEQGWQPSGVGEGDWKQTK